jgi:hypothetical protein
MDLILTPDLYEPSINDMGIFIDKIPAWSCLKGKGIMCSCGTRKNKVYETSGTFSSHLKTQGHKQWIENLNANKVNFYLENVQMKKIIHELRSVLDKYEKELSRVKTQMQTEISNRDHIIATMSNLLNDTSTDDGRSEIDLMNLN